MLNYVPDDGYTEPAYIAGVPQFYGEMRFTFRRVINPRRAEHIALAESVSEVQFQAKSAELLAEYIKEWDLKTPKGTPLPINKANVARVLPPLLRRVYGIVMSFEPSDRDPNWTDSEAKEAAESSIEGNEGN